MRLRGIVLNSIDYKEASKIVYLYTQIGAISVKAVGANKPKNGLLGFTTSGNIVDFVITDGDFPSVIEYQIEKSPWLNNKSLGSLESIMTILRVVKALPSDIDHKRTYSFLENILNQIDEGNYKKALALLLIKLTYSFGVAPRLKECECGAKENLVGFKVSAGGALCRSCAAGLSNLELLEAWKKYYYDRDMINEIPDLDFKKLFPSIEDYYHTHIHINLKLGFIEK